MGLNPIKNIIKALDKLLSNLNCRLKMSCCDCDCKMSPEETEEIIEAATMIYLNCKYPNFTEDMFKQMNLSEL